MDFVIHRPAADRRTPSEGYVAYFHASFKRPPAENPHSSHESTTTIGTGATASADDYPVLDLIARHRRYRSSHLVSRVVYHSHLSFDSELANSFQTNICITAPTALLLRATHRSTQYSSQGSTDTSFDGKLFNVRPPILNSQH